LSLSPSLVLSSYKQVEDASLAIIHNKAKIAPIIERTVQDAIQSGLDPSRDEARFINTCASRVAEAAQMQVRKSIAIETLGAEKAPLFQFIIQHAMEHDPALETQIVAIARQTLLETATVITEYFQDMIKSMEE